MSRGVGQMQSIQEDVRESAKPVQVLSYPARYQTSPARTLILQVMRTPVTVVGPGLIRHGFGRDGGRLVFVVQSAHRDISQNQPDYNQDYRDG